MNRRISLFKLIQYNITVMLLTVSVNAAVYSQIPVGSTGKTEALLNEPI